MDPRTTIDGLGDRFEALAENGAKVFS
jgi:hypothetical protein